MTLSRSVPLALALALAGCEAKDGGGGAAEAGNVSAEGKAEENMVSIKAPGVDIKVNLPESARARADVESDSELLYPGSTVGGIHIEAGGGDRGAVEIRFSSPDAPTEIAAWYRDPARTAFKIESEGREGSALVLRGRETDDNKRFKLRLGPRGGGTDGSLSIQD